MATEASGLEDSVSVDLNPDPDAREAQADSLPDRPSDTAAKTAWVDYTVALGADRTYVEGDTQHFENNDEADVYVTHSGLTRADLIDLADRLGG